MIRAASPGFCRRGQARSVEESFGRRTPGGHRLGDGSGPLCQLDAIGRTSLADADSREVTLEVSDSGIGIPIEEQDRLFEPFFRSTNGLWIEAQGSGLGLAIVYKIVSGHNGRVDLESRCDEGTTVTVFLLPLTQPREE